MHSAENTMHGAADMMAQWVRPPYMEKNKLPLNQYLGIFNHLESIFIFNLENWIFQTHPPTKSGKLMIFFLIFDPFIIFPVGFGSMFQGWIVSLKQFPEMYASKFGVHVDKMMKELWEENILNSRRQWSGLSLLMRTTRDSWMYVCMSWTPST